MIQAFFFVACKIAKMCQIYQLVFYIYLIYAGPFVFLWLKINKNNRKRFENKVLNNFSI